MVCLVGTMLIGCSQQEKKQEVKLNPKKPVNIAIWHYYNGMQQVAFDNLVDEFNSTEGKDKGIYVEAHSQGSVNELEQKVLDSFKKKVGSEDAPDIFSSYADTAYTIEKMGDLVNIADYMTEKELEQYVDSFLEEGYIGSNGELCIFPIAKSSEIFMLDKTDWNKFSKETGANLEQLKTMEGLVQTAKQYYEWTDGLTPDIKNDGKAFYGRDAMANLFVIGSMQLGTEIFQVENQKLTLNVDQDVMRKIWDCYYVPYINGWFTSYGRFRSDDMKIGELIAFTGSTSSALYFPEQVETGEENYKIECKVLPDPVFEGGKPYAVQQGAGMVITKSTPEREYASIVFLKWLTEEKNNIVLGCTSGYIPVKKEAIHKEVLDQVMEEKELEVSQKTYDALITCFETMESSKLYTNKAFENGASARKVLEYQLSDKAATDREVVEKRLKEGQSIGEATADFVKEEAFQKWYRTFKQQLEQAIDGK